MNIYYYVLIKRIFFNCAFFFIQYYINIKMGCSCRINEKENEIIYTNQIKIDDIITNDCLSLKYDSCLYNKDQIYPENISNSINKASLNNKIISKIKPQEILSLLNILPPLKDKIEIELHLPIKYENKSEYWGETKKSTRIRHGRGIQIWIDGTKYIGYWLNDKANIKGKLIHSNGDIYEGDWKDDKVEGYGIYLHVDGSKYEGQWKEDKQHGKGIETWTDGTNYEGNYIEGKKQGFGIFKWSDGSIYEGEFNDNAFNGYGTYKWNDKRQFTGTWKNNKMEGKGIFIWPDGRKYEGEYKDDKKEGYGEFEWDGGKKFKGYWKNGKQHGEGLLYSIKNKNWRKGIWENGKRIKWIKD